MRVFAVFALACCCALPAQATDPVSIPLDPATLAALLRHAGAIPDGELRGAQFARFVEADARDGYRVVFSLGELDPATGARRVFVVDRCDGKPLDGDVGPVRLLVPHDARPARWVRQLDSITVSDP